MLVILNSNEFLKYHLNFRQVEEENESLGQQFRQEMLQRFQQVDKDVGNYTQELVGFCSSLKDQMNSLNQQSKNTDAKIKHISKNLVQQEISISEKLTETTNSSVSHLKRLLGFGFGIFQLVET